MCFFLSKQRKPNVCRGLIVTHTREQCKRIHKSLVKYTERLGLTVAMLTSGLVSDMPVTIFIIPYVFVCSLFFLKPLFFFIRQWASRMLVQTKFLSLGLCKHSIQNMIYVYHAVVLTDNDLCKKFVVFCQSLFKFP